MKLMRKIAHISATGRLKDQDPNDLSAWSEVTFTNPINGATMTKIMRPKKAREFVKLWRSVFPIGGKHIKRSERVNGVKHEAVMI